MLVYVGNNLPGFSLTVSKSVWILDDKYNSLLGKKIEIIEKLILATIPTREPESLLEGIIKDADMDNLGTEKFFDSNDRLKHEREMIKKIRIKDPEWRHASLNLIEGYHFYTGTQEKERNAQLKENIERLKKEL